MVEFKLSLSDHIFVLLFFLGFRLGALLTYLFGLLFTSNFILIFIIVILLLAADFWFTKNIAGRLLVGLRWWNEASSTGESVWVFESADPQRVINPTDSKFFWTALYATPAIWGLFALMSLLKLAFLWLILVVIAVTLSMTNTLAFGRCDRWSKASGIASSVFTNVGIMRRLGGGLFSRFFG